MDTDYVEFLEELAYQAGFSNVLRLVKDTCNYKWSMPDVFPNPLRLSWDDRLVVTVGSEYIIEVDGVTVARIEDYFEAYNAVYEQLIKLYVLT